MLFAAMGSPRVTGIFTAVDASPLLIAAERDRLGAILFDLHC